MFPEMSNMKVSLYNALVIVAVVLIFIPLLKYAMVRFPVPGLSGLASAV
jgi:hypothetical protein